MLQILKSGKLFERIYWVNSWSRTFLNKILLRDPKCQPHSSFQNKAFLVIWQNSPNTGNLNLHRKQEKGIVDLYMKVYAFIFKWHCRLNRCHWITDFVECPAIWVEMRSEFLNRFRVSWVYSCFRFLSLHLGWTFRIILHSNYICHQCNLVSN